MAMGSEYHRARRRDPKVVWQRRSYKGAYNRALARLRDEHRGRFADILREELDSRRADELLAQENARITDEWYEEAA